MGCEKWSIEWFAKATHNINQINHECVIKIKIWFNFTRFKIEFAACKLKLSIPEWSNETNNIFFILKKKKWKQAAGLLQLGCEEL